MPTDPMSNQCEQAQKWMVEKSLSTHSCNESVHKELFFFYKSSCRIFAFERAAVLSRPKTTEPKQTYTLCVFCSPVEWLVVAMGCGGGWQKLGQLGEETLGVELTARDGLKHLSKLCLACWGDSFDVKAGSGRNENDENELREY